MQLQQDSGSYKISINTQVRRNYKVIKEFRFLKTGINHVHLVLIYDNI